MINEFNYTRRQRIETKHLSIGLVEPNDGDFHSFNVELNLEELQLPPEAPLVVEASRGSSVMRFPWGTAGQPLAPSNRELSDVPAFPSFRVMALAPDDSGRILALANQVKPSWEPSQPTGTTALIPVSEEDLGQEVWRLDLPGGGDPPVLKVNQGIEGISNTVKYDPAFRSLVFPVVLRSVLTKALLIEEAEPEDAAGYLYGWLGFVGQFYDVPCPGLAEIDSSKDNLQKEQRGWIEGAVEAFTREHFKAKDIYANARR